MAIRDILITRRNDTDSDVVRDIVREATNSVYFAKNGDDANSGLHASLPKLTLDGAIATAAALLPTASNPVAIVCLDGGEYANTANASAFYIPAYCHLIAPAASFIGVVNSLDQSVFLLAADSSIDVGKVTGFGDSGECVRIIGDGAHVRARHLIGKGGFSTIACNGGYEFHLHVDQIECSGGGDGIGLSDGYCMGYVCRIRRTGDNGTTAAISCAGAGMDITVQSIDAPDDIIAGPAIIAGVNGDIGITLGWTDASVTYETTAATSTIVAYQREGATNTSTYAGSTLRVIDASSPYFNPLARTLTGVWTVNGSVFGPMVDYGNGEDGTLDLTGSPAAPAYMTKVGSVYTLTRDAMVTDLVVPAGVTVVTAGFNLRCSGTFSGAGEINWNGTAGTGGGTGSAAQAGGGTTIATTYGLCGSGGSDGAAGTTTGGAAGGSTSFTAGAALGNPVGSSISVAAGNGGAGGTGSGGGGGATAISVAAGVAQSRPRRWGDLISVRLNGFTSGTGMRVFCCSRGGRGGSSGGGDTTNSGGSGGGGGQGGNFLIVVARTWSFSGTLAAKGGAGGNGRSPTAGNCGGGGGGGGGNGGLIAFAYSTKTLSPTLDVSAGAGGAGAAGTGTGTAGSNGTAGTQAGFTMEYDTLTDTTIYGTGW